MFLLLLLLAFSSIRCADKGALSPAQLKKIDEQVQEAAFAEKFEQAKTQGCFATFFKNFAAVPTSNTQTRADYVRCL